MPLTSPVVLSISSFGPPLVQFTLTHWAFDATQLILKGWPTVRVDGEKLAEMVGRAWASANVGNNDASSTSSRARQRTERCRRGTRQARKS